MILLKSTVLNSSVAVQKEEPMFSHSAISIVKLALLNLLSSTSKCASWEISRESLKSDPFSEPKIHSLIDTCASSLVSTLKWPSNNTISNSWTSSVNFSLTCSTTSKKDMPLSWRQSTNNSSSLPLNAKFQSSDWPLLKVFNFSNKTVSNGLLMKI